MRTLYLNNKGSKWVILPKPIFLFKDGRKRKALWFESWGNFSVAVFSIKGKKEKLFIDDERIVSEVK